MSEDDQLTTAASIIDQRQLHGESPNQSPRKPTEFVQSVIYELLRNSGFKITAKMQELPTQTLITIKEAVDHQLEKTPKPKRNSVVSIARAHLSGEAKQRKSLDLATRKLDTAISKSPPPVSDSQRETLKSSK